MTLPRPISMRHGTTGSSAISAKPVMVVCAILPSTHVTVRMAVDMGVADDASGAWQRRNAPPGNSTSASSSGSSDSPISTRVGASSFG